MTVEKLKTEAAVLKKMELNAAIIIRGMAMPKMVDMMILVLIFRFLELRFVPPFLSFFIALPYKFRFAHCVCKQ